MAAWTEASPAPGGVYLALYNLLDSATGAAAAPVPVALAELGLKGPVRVRDLWRHEELPFVHDVFVPQIPCHGAGLYRMLPA